MEWVTYALLGVVLWWLQDMIVESRRIVDVLRVQRIEQQRIIDINSGRITRLEIQFAALRHFVLRMHPPPAGGGG